MHLARVNTGAVSQGDRGRRVKRARLATWKARVAIAQSCAPLPGGRCRLPYWRRTTALSEAVQTTERSQPSLTLPGTPQACRDSSERRRPRCVAYCRGRRTPAIEQPSSKSRLRGNLTEQGQWRAITGIGSVPWASVAERPLCAPACYGEPRMASQLTYCHGARARNQGPEDYRPTECVVDIKREAGMDVASSSTGLQSCKNLSRSWRTIGSISCGRRIGSKTASVSTSFHCQPVGTRVAAVIKR